MPDLYSDGAAPSGRPVNIVAEVINLAVGGPLGRKVKYHLIEDIGENQTINVIDAGDGEEIELLVRVPVIDAVNINFANIEGLSSNASDSGYTPSMITGPTKTLTKNFVAAVEYTIFNFKKGAGKWFARAEYYQFE